MRPTRLLGAATAVLLTGTMIGATPARAAPADNARARWDGKRVVQLPGAPDGSVQVLGGGNDQWSLVARNIGNDTWRLRESTDGRLGYTNLPNANIPLTVTRFQAATSPNGWTIGAYEDSGRLYGYGHYPEGIRGAQDLAAVQAGPTALAIGTGAEALIAHGDTWHQHFDQTQTGNDGDSPHWESYPDPNVDGVPGAAGQRFGFTGGDLLAFWNDSNGDLRAARRPVRDTAAAFSAPQTIATGGEKVVRFVETSVGPFLITQAPDGTVSLRAYEDDPAGFVFSSPRRLAGPVATGEPVAEPQVALSRGGILTVGWQERGVEGGGLVLWQQDRPLSTFLERPALVPGTRDTDARVVTSPRGSLAVAFRRDSEDAIVRVKHLPAGKTKWTDGIRLVSPKPVTGSSAAWAIGTPTNNQDLRVAVNDTVGVYGFRFDAPRPYTKMVKPARRMQRTKAYRIGWNTSWSFADDWSVRARVDKGRTYGPWRFVGTDDGARSKVVTRPRGEKRCYQARGLLNESHVTRWSAQRCVTVRK